MVGRIFYLNEETFVNNYYFPFQYHVKLAYKEGHKQNIPDWEVDNGLR